MEKRKRTHFKKPTRAVALILVVVLALSSILTTLGVASRVKIPQTEKNLSTAAENYLVSRTDYVNDPPLRRMADYVGTMTGQDTLQDFYALSGVQIAREDYALALESVDKCLALYTGDGDEDKTLLTDLWLKKGCLHVLLGEYDEAIPALDKVLEIDPEAIDAYLIKAQVFEALGLTRDMCVNLGHFLMLAPGRGESEALIADLWLSKGIAHVTLGEYDDALYALGAALDIDETLSEAHLAKAQVFALQGAYREMCGSLEAYLELEPDDEDMARLLAETLDELSRAAAANADPGGGTASAGETSQTGEGNISGEANPEQQTDTDDTPALPTVESEFLAGLYAMQEEDYAVAETAISRAIAIDDAYEGVHFYRGVCRLSLENYTGAAEDFLASISYGHMVQSSHYNRGVSLIMADDYEQGREEIRRAAELDEDESVKARAEAFLLQLEEAETETRLIQYLTLAQVCADLEDYAGMSAHLEAYLAEVPDDSQIRAIWAQALYAGGEYSQAMEQYSILLKNGPNAEYEYNYGLSALQLQDFTAARDAFTRTIAIFIWPGAFYYRGVCRLSLEDYKAAISDFTTSIRLNDMVHSSYFNRGICRLLLEDYEAGMSDVRTAANMTEDPEISKQAQQLLADIENASDQEY